MDETDELVQLCVRALVSQMIAAPRVELHVTRNGVLGLTDEPIADFNRLILGSGPDNEGFLTRSVALAKARGSPLIATVTPQVAQSLMSIAARLGLTPAGTAPLMVLRQDVSVPVSRSIRIVRALGPRKVRIAGALIAAAFEEPRDVIARCIDVCMTPTSGHKARPYGRQNQAYAAAIRRRGRSSPISATPCLFIT